jgi:hypothetical protein
MKAKLEKMRSRRAFLKEAARRAVVPAVAAYTVAKTTPKLFAREPE